MMHHLRSKTAGHESLGDGRRHGSAQKFAVALLQLSVAVALAMTIVLRPYTVDAPKKILLQHLHIQVRVGQ